MSTLKETLKKKIEEHRPRTVRLLKEYGDVKISEVTIGQAIGGARGVKCLVTDVSYLDPFEGIRFRGRTIPETFAALPAVKGQDYPAVEGFFYYLMTGDIPTAEQAEEVVADFKKRRQLPQYVKDIMRAMPADTHPMTMFSAGIVAMQRESEFVKRYNEGMNKMEYWEPMFEDSCNLMAKLPVARGLHLSPQVQERRADRRRSRSSTWAATSPTRWGSTSPTTTLRGCTSSSTRITSRATSPPTPPTWWRRRCRMPTTRCRPE